MRLFIKFFVVLQISTLVLLGTSFAQQDSLVSFDDVEFTDGSSSTDTDTLVSVPDDLVFTDGADSTVGETAASDESVTEVEAAAG
ncbi:hypothetical protein BC792_111122, partial [Sphingobacterium allocomposti]